MLYEWADNHSHQPRRSRFYLLFLLGIAKTAAAGALSITWMGEGRGEQI